MLLTLLPLTALAQTVYQWEDADGVHVTQDLQQVPVAARSRVQAMTFSTAAPRPGGAPDDAKPAPAQAAPARTALDEPGWRARFVAVHRRIATLKQGVQALSVSLPPRTECVAQPLVPVGSVVINGTPAPITTGPGSQVVTQNGITQTVDGRVVSPAATCQVNPMHDRIRLQLAQEQVKLKDAEIDLEALDREASAEGVPREWRRGW
jgi:hypothetical protein